MFCPECESEYQAGFTRCVGCDVDLVNVLPKPQMGDPLAEPSTVFVAINASEANLVRSLLEGSGLEVSLFDENLSNIDPPAAIIIGGIKVAVPKHERELAMEVLEEYRGEAGQHATIGRFSPFSLEDVDALGSETREDEEYRCPQCRVLLEAETTVCPKCGAVSFGIEIGPAKPESRF